MATTAINPDGSVRKREDMLARKVYAVEFGDCREGITRGTGLSPRWDEWMIGFPIGWTLLDPLPTSSLGEWFRPGWWDTDPADIGVTPRLSVGEKSRREQIQALGNAQVPLCAATAWNLLAFA